MPLESGLLAERFKIPYSVNMPGDGPQIVIEGTRGLAWRRADSDPARALREPNRQVF